MTPSIGVQVVARTFEVGTRGKLPSQLMWYLSYGFVDAAFRSNFEVNGESNSSADENGNIQV